jgi:hypothetical protein
LRVLLIIAASVTEFALSKNVYIVYLIVPCPRNVMQSADLMLLIKGAFIAHYPNENFLGNVHATSSTARVPRPGAPIALEVLSRSHPERAPERHNGSGGRAELC